MSENKNRSGVSIFGNLLRKLVYTIAILAGLSIVLLFALVHWPTMTVPDVEPISQTVYQDQGWTQEPGSIARETYYFTPQGATIPPGSTEAALRYDWLVHLEKAWGRERFADPDHMRALGFIVDHQPSQANPDLLPVGFTRHWDDSLGEYLLDITCATCHTGQLNINRDGSRIAIRVEGGSANHAIMDLSLHQFGPALIGAMASTYFNPLKFKRFARNVLGENYKNGKKTLRRNLWKSLFALASQKQNSPFKKLYPVEEGYGRVDAIGRISNTVMGTHLDEDNFVVGNAPVSYPPVWNAWKFDWVQYSGSVKQPMARNMGEVLGVGARINLVDPYGRPLPASEWFGSSILVENLHRIETTLQQLGQPQWNETLLGPIDQQRAANGKKLFEQHCLSCHGPHQVEQKVKSAEAPLKGPDDPEWHVKLLSVEDIGTDSTAADNFVDNRFDMSGAGVKNEQVAALMRPYFVGALRNHVEAEFISPFLNVFLAADHPDSSELKRDTRWMGQESWKLETFESMFDNWRKTGVGELEQLMARTIADPDKIELVRIEIVRKALQKIEQHLAGIDLRSVSAGAGLNYLGVLLRKKYYADNAVSPAKQACLDGFGIMDLPQVVRAYKARPLGGMWATPPFLHNGSVPSIYQLLSPVEERETEFYVGQNTFDSEHLGFVLDVDDESGILLDTRIKGNHNTGHQFREGYKPYKEGAPPQNGIIGPPLSHDQRMEIIEYLKIHQDPPTPAGRVIQSCENM